MTTGGETRVEGRGPADGRLPSAFPALDPGPSALDQPDSLALDPGPSALDSPHLACPRCGRLELEDMPRGGAYCEHCRRNWTADDLAPDPDLVYARAAAVRAERPPSSRSHQARSATPCSVPRCGRPAKAHGLCQRCYMRAARRGKAEGRGRRVESQQPCATGSASAGPPLSTLDP